ncbi:MAG: LUD domain-containing protein [Pirellulales bacterium]|nr:LUD domain-containing protein [Pirellulales bacterium]
MPEVPPPPVPEVWPRLNPAPSEMFRQFAEELVAVQGEPFRCGTMAEARQTLAQLAEQGGWTAVGAMDRPLCREAAGGLPPERIQWSRPGWPPREMAELSLGVVDAEALLADTGSCLVACPTAEDRLLCYLPPACAVIAPMDRFFEHLPAAWETFGARCSGAELRGECVIITGPSRTADIEKTLILGVHGPKRLAVLVVEKT